MLVLSLGRMSWRGWGESILRVLLFGQPAGTCFPRTFDDILGVGVVEGEDTRVLGLTTGYVQSIPSYCCFSIPLPPRRRFSTPRNLHLLISPEPATPLALKHRTHFAPGPPQLCSPCPSFASYPSTLISLRPSSSSSSSVREYAVLVIASSTAGGSTRLWT